MILTGSQILAELGNRIEIQPFNINQLNSNSYNLKLHDELLVYKEKTLDMKIPNPFDRIHIPETGLLIMPGRLYLGRTAERTETRGLVPMIEGRSSIGRLGISVHETAGFGDIGFCGYWTFEISCIQPVIIYPNVEICQIYYHEVKDDHHRVVGTYDGTTYDTSKILDIYSEGKYQNNTDIQPSMIWKEFQDS